MRNGALKRIKQALKIPLAARQQSRQWDIIPASCQCNIYLKTVEKYIYMRECCRRSDVDVSEVSLPSQLLSPLSLSLSHARTHSLSRISSHAL